MGEGDESRASEPLRRKAKMVAELSEHDVAQLCARIGAKHLSLKQACARMYVSYRSVMAAVRGDEPKEPELAARIEAALAASTEWWIDFGRQSACQENTAGVRMTETMLKALDKDRFIDRQDAGRAGVTINFIQGDKPVQITAELVQDALPAEPLALEEGE